jgi:hypothetical protein
MIVDDGVDGVTVDEKEFAADNGSLIEIDNLYVFGEKGIFIIF